MGVLDEAIREHLELKRRHGVPEAEIAKDAAEALGPARRDAAAESPDAAHDELEAPHAEAPTQFLAGGDMSAAETSPAERSPDVRSDLPRSVPPPPDPGVGLREPDPASVPPPPPPPAPGAGPHDPDLRPPPPLPEDDVAEHEADSAFAPPPPDPRPALTELPRASVEPPPLHEEEDWESIPPEDELPDEPTRSPLGNDVYEDVSEPGSRPLKVFGDEPAPPAPPPAATPSDETQPMDLPDLWLGEQVSPGERPPLDERVRRARAEESKWRDDDDQADDGQDAPPDRPRRDRPDELDFDH